MSTLSRSARSPGAAVRSSTVAVALALAALGISASSVAATSAKDTGSKATAAKTSKPTAAKPATLASCSWDRPNQNPYMGELPAAIDRYSDIAPDVREKLKARVAAQQYDDMVEIRRDAIVGKHGYQPQIRDMHFGKDGRVCRTVKRNKWKGTTTERGLVYCESGQCVLVPTVCRNVSRVTRKPDPAAAEKSAAAPAAAPAAGPSAAQKPDAPVAASKSDDPGSASPAAAAGGAPTGAVSPAFNDVTAGPVFPFPLGPSGTSSIALVAPPAAPGGPGGGVGGGGTPVTPPGGDPGTPAPGATPPGGVVGGEAVVSPIPEPSTYALLLAGLGFVVAAARRRRTR
jgi:hypothetical protein